MQKNNSKSAPRRWSWGTFFLTIPYVIWMAVFILIPLGVVMFYALTDPATGLFSLDNLSKIFTGAFPRIFLRSVWYSLVASLICLVIGYPVAYFIARQRPGVQRFLVVWGLLEVMDIFWPTRRFIRVDFPTLGRPISVANPDLYFSFTGLPAESSSSKSI